MSRGILLVCVEGGRGDYRVAGGSWNCSIVGGRGGERNQFVVWIFLRMESKEDRFRGQQALTRTIFYLFYLMFNSQNKIFIYFNKKRNTKTVDDCDSIIDISWVDYPYTASTCDVILSTAPPFMLWW
jgi:hypothetical protein